MITADEARDYSGTAFETSRVTIRRAQTVETIDSLRDTERALQNVLDKTEKSSSKEQSRINKLKNKVLEVKTARSDIKMAIEGGKEDAKTLEETVREINLQTQLTKGAVKPILALIENLEKKDELNNEVEMRKLEKVHLLSAAIRSHHISEEFVELKKKRTSIKGDMAESQLDLAAAAMETGAVQRIGIGLLEKQNILFAKELKHLQSREKNLLERINAARTRKNDLDTLAEVTGKDLKEVREKLDDMLKKADKQEKSLGNFFRMPGVEKLAPTKYSTEQAENLGRFFERQDKIEETGLAVWIRPSRATTIESGPAIVLGGSETASVSAPVSAPEVVEIPEYLKSLNTQNRLVRSWTHWIERWGEFGYTTYQQALQNFTQLTGRTYRLDESATPEDTEKFHWVMKDTTANRLNPYHPLAKAFDQRTNSQEQMRNAETSIARDYVRVALNNNWLNYDAPADHFETFKRFASGEKIHSIVIALHMDLSLQRLRDRQEFENDKLRSMPMFIPQGAMVSDESAIRSQPPEGGLLRKPKTDEPIPAEFRIETVTPDSASATA